MSQESYILIAICIVIALGSSIVMNILKKKTYNELVTCLQNQDYHRFDELIKSSKVKFFFPPFNIDYIKLNRYILAEDRRNTDQMFEHIVKHRLNKKQKQEVYIKGFNYYIALDYKPKAKEFYDLVQTLDNAQIKRETDRLYDTYILNGYKYLDEMIDELDDVEETYRGPNEYLISLMYKNKGDDAKAKEYLDLAEKHMTMLDKELSEKFKKNAKNRAM